MGAEGTSYVGRAGGRAGSACEGGGTRAGRRKVGGAILNGFNGIYEWITKLGRLFRPCARVNPWPHERRRGARVRTEKHAYSRR